jgi:hypothetical protein
MCSVSSCVPCSATTTARSAFRRAGEIGFWAASSAWVPVANVRC